MPRIKTVVMAIPLVGMCILFMLNSLKHKNTPLMTSDVATPEPIPHADPNHHNAIFNIERNAIAIENKLSILKLRNGFNIPKLRLSIRILIKALEKMYDDYVRQVFTEYVGKKYDSKLFRSNIEDIRAWWLSGDNPLTYDNTDNGAHAKAKTISIGAAAMSMPVIHNYPYIDSIVSTLFHESLHAALGFSDYSTKAKGLQIDISDVYPDSRHGHYLSPSQCKHLAKHNKGVTLKNPQCWANAFITNYAYSKMCITVGGEQYNKAICRYSDNQIFTAESRWLEKLIGGLENTAMGKGINEQVKRSAHLILEKKFSLLITSYDDECKVGQQFHGNHKNIVICQSFHNNFNEQELTKKFFENLKDCNKRNSCAFPNNEELHKIGDLHDKVFDYMQHAQ